MSLSKLDFLLDNRAGLGLHFGLDHQWRRLPIPRDLGRLVFGADPVHVPAFLALNTCGKWAVI